MNSRIAERMQVEGAIGAASAQRTVRREWLVALAVLAGAWGLELGA